MGIELPHPKNRIPKCREINHRVKKKKRELSKFRKWLKEWNDL